MLLTRDDLESEIFVYLANDVPKFVYADSLPISRAFMDVLLKKYYETLENEHVLDYAVLLESEYSGLSKKRRQQLEVVLSLGNLR